VDVPLDNG
jgi:hypothetical protein